MNDIKTLQSTYLFRHMAATDIQCCLQAMTHTFYTLDKWEVLTKETCSYAPLYILLSGKLALTVDGIPGQNPSTTMLHAKECFGENMLGRHHARSYTLTAHTPCRILALQVHSLLAQPVFPQLPILLLNMIHHLGKQNIALHNQIAYSHISPLKTRVATYLVHRSKHYDAAMFTIPYNREEMAKYLGATRPAVSKILSEFKEAGLIDYYKNTFKINALEALQQQ